MEERDKLAMIMEQNKRIEELLYNINWNLETIAQCISGFTPRHPKY